MIARGVYRPWIVLRRITTRSNVRFVSGKNGKDANTQQSTKKFHTQQIGNKNVNDRGFEVDYVGKVHAKRFTNSWLVQPQPKGVLNNEEKSEQITPEEIKIIIESEVLERTVQDLKQDNKQSNKIAKGSVIAAVLIFGSAVYCQQQMKQEPQTLRKERIKKYTEQDLDITQFENQIYSKNQQNSTYKQLKLIVDHQIRGGLSLLQVVTGQPGNGKTTQLKRIVKDLRKQGHIVFYVNLRDDKKGETMAEGALSKAEEAMSQFLKTELGPNKKQKAFLFIDDINMLEPLQNKNQFQCWMRLFEFWTQMATVQKYYNFKTVVISSSSSYMDKLEIKSYVEKASLFHIITNKTTEQMRQSIENIFDFYLKEKTAQYQNVKRYLLDERYNLRGVIKIVDQLVSATTEENFLKELQTQEKSTIAQKSQMLYDKLLPIYNKRTKVQQKYDQGLLAEIVKLKQFDGTNGCLQARAPFRSRRTQKLVIQNTQGLQNYLEQQNLLFFCFPRSEMNRKIVQGLLDLMKDPQDK